MKHQSPIFDGGHRLQMTEGIELTVQSLQACGKDSSATLSVVCWLIDTGRIRAPKTLMVVYADRQGDDAGKMAEFNQARDDALKEVQ